ncbi:septum site-determining protein MinC [Ligilactobacillus sp. LYQ135]
MPSEAISLKGHKDGYELVLHSDASFEQILVDLKELLAKLYKDNSKFDAEKVEFSIKTRLRLLSADQRKKIEDTFTDYPLFSIHKIKSDVIEKDEAINLIEKNTIHLNADIIRNGQVRTIEGDVLFTGIIHEGGILQATGNVYLLGNVEGIVSAGYPDNESAVIVGNISAAQQVRIADLVTIFDDDNRKDSFEPVVYVNDLHKISYLKLEELKKLRPKIYAKIGGL